jgi:outer membrane protein assembly factor BamB
MRQLLSIVFLVALVAAPVAAWAENSSNSRTGVISPSVASRYGLKRAWFTQIEVDRSRGRVTHLNQYVSNARFMTVFEIKSPLGVEYITEREVDRWGKPLGIEGAEKLAKERVKKLKEEAPESKDDVSLKTLKVPEVTLYAQTDRGTLHAIDGATGKTKWVTTVGNPDHPSLAPGANDKFVATVNGSSVFVLDASTGAQVWTRRTDAAPGAGPAVSNDRVFVPTVTGKMEAYRLEDYRQPPWFYQSTGRLLVQPTISTASASWATDRGYLYVCDKERLGVRFRLEARDPILAHSTFLPPNRLFAASTDGYAYCVHEFNGEILWRFSVGDPISEPPVATPDTVYLVADDAGMYAVGPQDGLEKWWAPRIRKLLAASKDRVYCLNYHNNLVVLDARTGGQIDTMQLPQLDLLYTNWITDRIFIGTSTGVLQCLHESNAPWPTVHNVADSEASDKPKVIQKKGDDAPVKEEPAGEDPFGGGAEPADDPFGGGDKPADDPFGGGAGDKPEDDPFGGDAKPMPDEKPADDPFGGGDAGGGDDPFG